MKMFKIATAAIICIALFFACSKTNDVPGISKTENSVTVENGLVKFNTVNDYLDAVENKNGKREDLYSMLNQKKFKSLRGRQTEISNVHMNGSTINNFTDNFDSTLYSEYLLSVLNQNKMFVLDSFLIKVDMDNIFCSFIDLTTNQSDSADLVNNAFENSNVKVFLNTDEPVLEVLSRLRANELTWTDYQDSLARKGGQGICFKKGKDKQKVTQKITFATEGDHIVAVAEYNKYFLHFEMIASGYQKVNWAFAHTTLMGEYEYVGVCKGSGNGSFNLNTYTYPGYPRLLRYAVYSGGSALSVTKLRAKTIGGPANQNTVTASIGY